jgi:hypothetical protein
VIEVAPHDSAALDEIGNNLLQFVSHVKRVNWEQAKSQ